MTGAAHSNSNVSKNIQFKQKKKIQLTFSYLRKCKRKSKFIARILEGCAFHLILRFTQYLDSGIFLEICNKEVIQFHQSLKL